MRIASYNIRKAVGLDWRRDPGRVLGVLQEINADVVVLQEADRRVGQRAGVLSVDQLAQELGYVFADVSVRPLSHGWHGNAILYRPQGLMPDFTSHIYLPTLEPRGAVSVRFNTPDLEVVGVHLGLGRAMRRKQLIALDRALKTATHPVLIAGDFNVWRHEADIANMLGDQFETITPGHSFHAAKPITALDRFVLKGAVGHVDSHVHRSALASRASDHLPIVIDLEFPEGKT